MLMDIMITSGESLNEDMKMVMKMPMKAIVMMRRGRMMTMMVMVMVIYIYIYICANVASNSPSARYCLRFSGAAGWCWDGHGRMRSKVGAALIATVVKTFGFNNQQTEFNE